MPRHTDEATVSVHRLPTTTRPASEPPRWEVTYGSQATGWIVIGWIDEHHSPTARNPTYLATGIHPTSGRHVRLQGSSDFDERVNTIADFHQDPMTSRQHLGWQEVR